MKLKERAKRRQRSEQASTATATTIVGHQNQWLPYIFSGPAILIIGLVLAFPVLYAVYQSLFAIGPLQETEPFVGLENYLYLLRQPEFWDALWKTAVFVGGCVGLGLFLAVVFGFALNRAVSGVRFIRGLSILPYIVSSVAVAMMFRTLFNSEFGLPNQLLRLVGLDGLAWFSTPALAMLVVIVAQVWSDLPLALLFVLGGLQTIDQSYMDARGWTAPPA